MNKNVLLSKVVSMTIAGQAKVANCLENRKGLCQGCTKPWRPRPWIKVRARILTETSCPISMGHWGAWGTKWSATRPRQVHKSSMRLGVRMMLQSNLLALKKWYASDAHWKTMLECKRTEYVRWTSNHKHSLWAILGLPKFGPEPQFEPQTPKLNLRFGPVLVLVLSSGAGSVHGSGLGS